MRDSTPACRFCGAALKHIVLDLGEQPLANSFLTEADLHRPEPRYRLCVLVCDDCLLVQTDTTVPVRSGARLEVENFGGEIAVKTWAKNAVRIEASHSTRDRIVITASALKGTAIAFRALA